MLLVIARTLMKAIIEPHVDVAWRRWTLCLREVSGWREYRVMQPRDRAIQ